MGNDEVRARGGLSGAFFFVLIVFILVLVDAWFFSRGFLTSAEWRAGRGYFTAGVLVIALLLWLLVLRGTRSIEMARSEASIETVRDGGRFLQPIIAFVLLIASAAIVLGHTLPKYAHELDRQRLDTVPFVLAAAPGPERGGCRPSKASSPDFGEVTLCLPDRVADTATAATTVFVSGDRTRFGFSPRLFALDRPAAVTTSAPPPVPEAGGTGTDVKEIFREFLDPEVPDIAPMLPTTRRGGLKN